jgi:hypothetical protein
MATGGDRIASPGHGREEGADGQGPLAREGEITREGSAGSRVWPTDQRGVERCAGGSWATWVGGRGTREGAGLEMA